MQQFSQNKIRLTASAVGLSIQFLAMLLPWFQIGERRRNSYEVIDAAVLFDPTDRNWATVVEVFWLLIPAFAGFAVLIWIAGYKQVGVALTIIISLIVGSAGLGVLILTAFQIGNFLALVSSVATLIGVIGAKFVLGLKSNN